MALQEPNSGPFASVSALKLHWMRTGYIDCSWQEVPRLRSLPETPEKPSRLFPGCEGHSAAGVLQRQLCRRPLQLRAGSALGGSRGEHQPQDPILPSSVLIIPLSPRRLLLLSVHLVLAFSLNFLVLCFIPLSVRLHPLVFAPAAFEAEFERDAACASGADGGLTRLALHGGD